MKSMRAWCVAVALLAAAGCEEDGGPETISREVFVETYVALRVAELRERTDDGISAAARERVLAEKGVTEEELLAFAEVHGPDVNFMEQVWDEVETRLDEMRSTPDVPGVEGGAGGDPAASPPPPTPTRSWPAASSLCRRSRG